MAAGPSTSSTELRICHGCKESISGSSTYLKLDSGSTSTFFHTDHFTCVVCHQTLHQKKFFTHHDVFYCKADFEEKFLHICRTCNKRITGRVTHALDGYFHPEHFCCTDCGVQLDGPFYTQDDKPYCQLHGQRSTDTDDKSVPICRTCNKRISGRVTRFLDGYFHPEHFACTECGAALLDKRVYTKDSKPYCQLHGQVSIGLCSYCGEEVRQEQMTKGSGKIYHNTCLACHYCRRPLAKSGSRIFRQDNMLFCDQDYKELVAHRCTSCGHPILDGCIAVNAEFYHADCFRCVHCGVELNNNYLSVGGQLRCSKHISASSTRVACAVCTEMIPVHTVIAAVGAKFHPECFRCSFCQNQLEKVSAKLRDKLICCPDCLVTSSVSLLLPIKEGSMNRQLDFRIRNLIRSYKNELESDVPVSVATSSRKRATPRTSLVSVRHHRKTPTWAQQQQAASAAGQPLVETKLEWRKGDLIGKGSFGKVYMGMLVTGVMIAVKQIELNAFEDTEGAAQLQTEIDLMKRLEHPHIVALLGAEKVGTKLNILMEYVPGKSIDILLESFGVFQEPTIQMYTAQLLSALEYMHRMDVIHRDIKGKNVLVDTAGNLKLADFGSAKQFENILSNEAPSISYNYTPLWTAPEVLLGNYSRKVDIWSLGCVLIEMATSQSPWAECKFDNPFQALYHIGNSNQIPKIPDNLSESCQDFIRKCLTRAPEDRPDASELMSHEFMGDSFREGADYSSFSESDDGNDIESRDRSRHEPSNDSGSLK